MDPSQPPPEQTRLAQDRVTVAEGFWPKVQRLAGHLPFAEDLLAAYYAAMDTRTPFRVRATLLGALAYFVMPVDMIPDLVVGLGYTDDAAVLAAALKTLADHIRPGHRERARNALADLERGAA